MLYFNCLPGVFWLLVFCGSFSRCRRLVCGVDCDALYFLAKLTSDLTFCIFSAIVHETTQ